jgi:ADP-ribosylglycohydrolase
MDMSDRALGCLSGAAGGDSFGASVEFMSTREILRRYGPHGVTDLVGAFGLPPGVITDDTQQALAVASGLVKSLLHSLKRGVVRREVWAALKRWHASQSIPGQSRAPGGTSMGSLGRERAGTMKNPPNRSDSCGSVMRVHPVGIAFAGNPELAFLVGMEVSVLTHGGGEAVTAGGAMAALISSLMTGASLNDSLEIMTALINRLGAAPLPVTNRVLSLRDDELDQISMDEIGSGWEADDALAMSIFAARRYPDSYYYAVWLAVNHSGDSDSTGSMAGAIMGTLHGIDAVPRDWRDILERRAELFRLALALTP